jgi:hypothetical protein
MPPEAIRKAIPRQQQGSAPAAGYADKGDTSDGELCHGRRRRGQIYFRLISSCFCHRPEQAALEEGDVDAPAPRLGQEGRNLMDKISWVMT